MYVLSFLLKTLNSENISSMKVFTKKCTLSTLKELEKSWEMIKVAHEQEKKDKELIGKLKDDVEELTSHSDEQSGFATQQEQKWAMWDPSHPLNNLLCEYCESEWNLLWSSFQWSPENERGVDEGSESAADFSGGPERRIKRGHCHPAGDRGSKTECSRERVSGKYGEKTGQDTDWLLMSF